MYPRFIPPLQRGCNRTEMDLLGQKTNEKARWMRALWTCMDLHGHLNGGDEEDRTPDLRIANSTLSQLSYVPIIGVFYNKTAPPMYDVAE